MPPDDPLSLPNPPPPRPDRREAAIAMALRKFDGEPGPAVPAPPAATGGWWVRSRQPQFAMAMSLALIAIIGVPATWIAIQNGALEPPAEAPRAPVAPASAGPPAASVRPHATVPPSPPAPAEAEAKLPTETPKQVAAPPPPVADDALAKTHEAPAAQFAPAPPAPPPPPPPPPPASAPMAQKTADAATSGELVVTGSRVARPRVSGERDESDVLNSLPMREEPAAAPDWVLRDRAYRTFLAQLQSAVRANDRGAVVKLVALPLRVNSNGKSQVYRDSGSVKRDYGRIFTAPVRHAILSQRFERLFGRDRGVMIGSGQVWFDHVGSDRGPVRITAINR